MRRKTKSPKEKREEQCIRRLAQLYESRGVKVRREKLSRGHSFRVKSGDCRLEGDTHVFVDRRLPAEQQISVLIDYLYEFRISISSEELENFPAAIRSLIHAKVSLHQNEDEQEPLEEIVDVPLEELSQAV